MDSPIQKLLAFSVIREAQGIDLDAGLAADMLERAAREARKPVSERSLHTAIDTAVAAVDLLRRTEDRLAVARARLGVP
jgi:hypothetical protein